MLGWRLTTYRTPTYLMKLRMPDRGNIFSRRALSGENTMQTLDANDLNTIVIKLWHIRARQIPQYPCPSFLTCVDMRWAQPMSQQTARNLVARCLRHRSSRAIRQAAPLAWDLQGPH